MRNLSLMRPAISLLSLIIQLPAIPAQQPNCDYSRSTTLKTSALGLSMCGVLVAVGGSVNICYDLYAHRRLNLKASAMTLIAVGVAASSISIFIDAVNHPRPYCFS